MDKIIDFYKGFEGEGETQFILQLKDKTKTIVKIWDGFVDDIMDKIEPEANGWTGLAYYYNLDEGWFDDSPWMIPSIEEALDQFRQVENATFRFEKTQDVIKEICNLLAIASETHCDAFIAKE